MNKFLLWIEQSGLDNTLSYTDFNSSTQRSGGFVSGSTISSTHVNTALRQANLVSAAFMNAILPNDTTLDFRSSLSDMITAITNGLKGIKSNTSGTADNATNVTTNINGKSISSIFETNGTTVKNATNAASANTATTATSAGAATNVTTNINGKAITTIFESNGTTVKNATSASNATNATNSTNATNVTITTDGTVGNNVVKFNIGTGTYNKTINNVANATHATSADSATNATNATNAGNATTVTNGVYTTDINKSTETKFGNYILRKEKLLKKQSLYFTNYSSSNGMIEYYTDSESLIGRKFRLEYYLGTIYTYNVSTKKSIEFEIGSQALHSAGGTGADQYNTILDQAFYTVGSSGPNQGWYMGTLIAGYKNGDNKTLQIQFVERKLTSLNSDGSSLRGEGAIIALYEII